MSSPPPGAEPATPILSEIGNPLLDEPKLVEDEVALTMNKRIDLAGSLAVTAVGVVVLVVAFTYPTPAVVFDAIGPTGFPKVIGTFLVVGGLVQSVTTARYLRRFGSRAPEEGAEDEPGHPSSRWRALGMMAGIFGYLALLEPVGFEIMTPIGVAGALWSLHYRNWLWRAVVGVAFTVVAFVLFGLVLGVPLPHGLLEDPLLNLGLVSF